MVPNLVLFNKVISIYQILSLIGIFVCGIYACKLAKKRGYDDNDMISLLLVAGIGVLIGGHLLYGLLNFPLFLDLLLHLDRIQSAGQFLAELKVIFGGAVFYGGLMGGMAAGFWFARKKHYPIADYMDMLAPTVPLFHTLGRIGCFLGGCCYGPQSPIGFLYRYSMNPMANGVRRFPIQLVEALLNLLLFLVLAYLLRKGIYNGRLFYLYLTSYAVMRFILEFWRADEYRGIWFGFSTSQYISVGLLIFVWLVCLRSRLSQKSLPTASNSQDNDSLLNRK